MSHIRTQLISSDSPEELWGRLETFAASFNHLIHRRFAHVVFKNEHDQWLGYQAILSVPVSVMAIHPNTEHRPMLEILRMAEGHSKIQYGDVFVAAPDDSPLLPYLTKRGFKDLGLHIHYAE